MTIRRGVGGGRRAVNVGWKEGCGEGGREEEREFEREWTKAEVNLDVYSADATLNLEV